MGDYYSRYDTNIMLNNRIHKWIHKLDRKCGWLQCCKKEKEIWCNL